MSKKKRVSRPYVVVGEYPDSLQVAEVHAKSAADALRKVIVMEFATTVTAMPRKDWRAMQKDAK